MILPFRIEGRRVRWELLVTVVDHQLSARSSTERDHRRDMVNLDDQITQLVVDVQVCGPVQQLLQGHYTMQVCQVAVQLVGHTQVNKSHDTTDGVNSEEYDHP